MLRLRTFGGLSIERFDVGASSGVATSARRRLALLAVLAANGARAVPRDRLLALFWPESDSDRARHALDQSLYQLKRDYGADRLLLGREELSLDPSVITSDIGEFRGALEQGDHARAVELYTGPFLDGVYVAGAPEFEHWVDSERVTLVQALERALETLANEAGARGDHQAAVQWCQRLAALDPRKTRSVVALMSALAASGDRSGALRYAEMYRTLVGDDELEPNPGVAALAEQLRRQPLPAATPSPLSQTPPGRQPGSVTADHEPLAGRYVIEREIGRGGSATVFVARDLRTERNVALKVLRPELAAGIAVDRFRQEITVTAKLQHPHILPVYDSGELNGTLFFVTPFVEGESLREHLLRVGRVPPAEVVRLGIEIADALAYAHAHGIIHRDIKPENILLASGHAVVADFGVARALDRESAAHQLTTPGYVEGTAAYLSPEQVSGHRADARSDQYSLAYMLYELLTGEPPFPGPGVQEMLAQRLAADAPSVRMRFPDVPAPVDQAIARALARNPAARFADLATFARALGGTPTTMRKRAGEWLGNVARRRPKVLVLAGALVLLVIVAVTLLGRSARALNQRAWIILTDFENKTGDSIFDGALDAALFAGLQQSDYISVYPRSRIQQALMRMGVTGVQAQARLDEARAREVALREGVQAVVAGAIHAVDSSYTITLRVLDAGTGDPLAAHVRQAKGRTDVLATLDELVRRLRNSIGESAEEIARHDLPLPRVTTSSLEALRKYANGVAALRAGHRAAAEELWQEAVALDSSFALAHVELGAAAYWANDRPAGDAHFDRALSLLDRLTIRERFQTRAAVERWRGNRDRAIELRLALLTEYPNDPTVWGAIGYDYMRLGRAREAIAALKKQLERDPTSASDHINLAAALGMTGEHDDAVRSYQRAFALQPSFLTVNNLNHEFGRDLVLAGRISEARAAHDSMLRGTPDQRAHGERSIAWLEMQQGRYDTAIAHFRQAILLSQRPNRQLTQARNRLLLAAALRAKGGRSLDSVSAEIRLAHALFRTGYIEPRFLLFLGSALSRDGQLDRAQEVLDTLGKRARQDNPDDRASLLALAGELALARQLPDSAVRSLRLAAALDSSAFISEALARALARAGDIQGAIRLYESLGRTPGRWYGLESQAEGLLAPWHLGRLYELVGDTTRAVAAYARLLAQWPGGDPDLLAVQEARSRLAALKLWDDRGSRRR